MTPLPEEIFTSLHPAVQIYIRYLEQVIREQVARILQLEARVLDLENRLSKNSSNSSKPPSSDGLKKPKKTNSQREPSGKKPGGQMGRQGATLNQVENPDHIVIHTPASCNGCSHPLSGVQGLCLETREVFKMPKPEIEVTEHRVEAKVCPCCNKVSKGVFPGNVTSHVQYGERVHALVAYFQHQHFLPVNRVCQIFEDIFGIEISPGTCATVDQSLFDKLAVFEMNLKASLGSARQKMYKVEVTSGIEKEKKF